MSVSSETAKVYRGGGRRWFTLQAACNAQARAKIMERCECEPFDPLEWRVEPITCDMHATERYPKILRRLSKIYRNAYRAEAK